MGVAVVFGFVREAKKDLQPEQFTGIPPRG